MILRPPPSRVNGKWIGKSLTGGQKKLRVLQKEYIGRVTYAPPPKGPSKAEIKAKKRHDLNAMAEKAKKYPPLILEQKQQSLMNRVQNPRGIQWFTTTWQKRLSKDRRRRELDRTDLMKATLNEHSLPNIFRHKLIRYMNLKPWETLGTRG